MSAEPPTRQDEVETWESARGTLAITHPAPGVIVFKYHGYMTAEVVPFIESSVNRVLAAGHRPDLFVDVEDMSGYDSEYRQEVSKWGSRYLRRFGETHFLVRSKIIAMGIAVSNLTAGGRLKPTTRRSEFQAALDAAISRHTSAK